MAINSLNELINLDTLLAALDEGEKTIPFFVETQIMEGNIVLASSWRMRGAPGRGSLQTAGMNGAARVSDPGGLPFANAAVGNTKHLAALQVTASTTGTLLLCDKLWDQNGLTVTQTSVQNVAYPTLPPRDINGTTTGNGVFPILEVTSNTTNAANIANMTIRADPVGAEGAINMQVRVFPSTAANNTTVIPVPNATTANAITGITGANGVTLGTSLVAGVVNLAAIRVIAMTGITTASIGLNLDAFDLGLPRLYDGSSLFFMWLPTTGANTQIYGVLRYAEGPLTGANNAFLPPISTRGFMATAAAGFPHTSRRARQFPSKGTTETMPGALTGAVVNTGHIPFTNPAGANNAYLTGFTWAQTTAGAVTLVDRLWHSGTLSTATGAQTVNSVTLPARDALGTTNGHGVGVAVHFQTAMGANTALATITYTNSDGVGSRTGYMQRAAAGWNGAVAAIAPFTLQQGDKGVRSIQSFNWGGGVTSGTAYLMMYRKLARIDQPVATTAVTRNFGELGMPRLYSNTSLEFWIETDVNATFDWYGLLHFAHG